MNSENSKTSVTHRLRLNLMDKVDLQKRNKRVELLELSMH